MTPLHRLRDSLEPERRREAAMVCAVVVALHAIGFGVLLGAVVPRHLELGGGAGVFGIGLGLTAYTLGLRHAFDADHIGAIDTTTRKLMADGQRPVSVGFFFSLGHSTIVFALTALIATGVRGLGGAVAQDDSTLHRMTGVIGPAVSGSFLVLMGLLNLAILVGTAGVVRRLRRGELDEEAVQRQLVQRGPMSRLTRRATRAVGEPWHMYPLGVLFGLGFDTATEVALLATAGTAAAGGLPLYAVLCLPVLFAAGMSLLDTAEGAFMTAAYRWAFLKPARKLFYNLAVTGLSVAVALLVGGIELAAVLSDRLGLEGGIWDALTAIDLQHVGYLVVALFALTWAGALAVWRFGRIEERWTR